MSSSSSVNVGLMLRARQTLLWIVTREELRVERAVIEAAASVQFRSVLWDVARGGSLPDGKPWGGSEADAGRIADPGALLGAIRNDRTRTAWILRDFHRWTADPVTVRALKNLARDLEAAPVGAERAIVVLAPTAELPEELRGMATVVEWPLPDRAEVARILDATVTSTLAGLRARPGTEARAAELERSASNGVREAAIDAAVGLTAREIADCYARSLAAFGALRPDVIRKDKASVISASKVLEWYEPEPRGMAAIGGLDKLKLWLTDRSRAFSPRARAFGVPAPRGAVLVGVPGCGKSLACKAIATSWGMPLLRLDIGALRSKYVGESEGNIRRALRTAESVSPCVLWLDEIEKAIPTGPQGDGGVSADALGAILTWMQERAGSVFVVATSNDVSGLPPELLRAGRFDAVFFVDLPTSTERVEILRAALGAHGRDSKGIDLGAVAEVTAEYTGAELASLIPTALYRAFGDGERAITTADLVTAARAVVPLARTAAERIAKLREWAAGRAVPASTPEERAEVSSGYGRAVL